MITLQSSGVSYTCVSMRLFTPQRGAWFADIDLDLLGSAAIPQPSPTGPCTITISSDDASTADSLRGTIDPLASGRFAGMGKVRVVAGGGGWATMVPRQQFQQTPVTSTTVYQATAALVNEVVTDPNPATFDTEYIRIAGPASRVFGDRPWYMTAAGGTLVAAWPIIQSPADMQVISFDPLQMRFEVASSRLLTPGLQLVDAPPYPRWDGTFTVVDVEQHFTPHGGSRASLWVSSSSQSRFLSAMTNMVRELTRRDLDRIYRYRVVSQSGSMLTVQAIDSTLGIPDMLQIPVETAPGVSAQFVLGSNVGVAFLDGSPGFPRVICAEDTATLGLALAGGQLGALTIASAFGIFLQAVQASTPSGTETGYAALKIALQAAFPTAASYSTAKVTAS